MEIDLFWTSRHDEGEGLAQRGRFPSVADKYLKDLGRSRGEARAILREPDLGSVRWIRRPGPYRLRLLRRQARPWCYDVHRPSVQCR